MRSTGGNFGAGGSTKRLPAGTLIRFRDPSLWDQFRVAQEALQNALKYSHATELTVDVRGTLHGLTLTIIDNGVGFDVDADWGKGVGLRSMFERLQATGGSLNLTSHPDGGTRVVATPPRHVVESDPNAEPA